MIDTAPYDRIVLDKETKSELRVYDGDKDPNILNKKRIGVYLFVNNAFIASEWIECGKVVKNTLVNNPKITNKVKADRLAKSIANMKVIWNDMNDLNEDELCE